MSSEVVHFRVWNCADLTASRFLHSHSQDVHGAAVENSIEHQWIESVML
jgi:hypothetical protein